VQEGGIFQVQVEKKKGGNKETQYSRRELLKMQKQHKDLRRRRSIFKICGRKKRKKTGINNKRDAAKTKKIKSAMRHRWSIKLILKKKFTDNRRDDTKRKGGADADRIQKIHSENPEGETPATERSKALVFPWRATLLN